MRAYTTLVRWVLAVYATIVVPWVRVPPEAANFSRKSDCLGCAVLLCLVVCLTLLASFFSSFSSHIKNMHNTQVQYILVIFADLYFHKWLYYKQNQVS